jgi:1-acyl-sn-glycerol-3-phosphate acyltransferase
MLGIELCVRGATRIDLKRPHVFVSNHRSAIDPLLLVAALRHMPRFVAKVEVGRIPLFGLAFQRLGHIAIDRGRPDQARRTLMDAAQRLGRAHSVYFAPEGTRRGGTPPELSGFRRGAFEYALAVGLPVAPIAIFGSDTVWPPGGLRIETGRVALEFLTPVPAEGSADQLRQNVYSALAASGVWEAPQT